MSLGRAREDSSILGDHLFQLSPGLGFICFGTRLKKFNPGTCAQILYAWEQGQATPLLSASIPLLRVSLFPLPSSLHPQGFQYIYIYIPSCWPQTSARPIPFRIFSKRTICTELASSDDSKRRAPAPIRRAARANPPPLRSARWWAWRCSTWRR